MNWSTEGGSVDNNQTVRNLYYQLQLNWARKFGQHDVSVSYTHLDVYKRQAQSYFAGNHIHTQVLIIHIIIDYLHHLFHQPVSYTHLNMKKKNGMKVALASTVMLLMASPAFAQKYKVAKVERTRILVDQK